MNTPTDLSVIKTASSRPYLHGLSALRVVAMLFVFYCHLPTIPSFRYLYSSFFEPVRVGAIGVSFFFVLSGFSMIYNHSAETMKGGLTRFLARIAKFYPTALFILVLSIPLGFVGGLRDRMHPVSIVANILLLEAWHDAWNITGVNWFLSALAFFYLMFPFVNTALLSKTGFKFLAILAVVFWVVSLVGTTLNPGRAVFFKTFPAFRIFEFILGMVAGRLYLRQPLLSRLIGLLYGIVGIVWLFAALFLQRHVAFFGETGVYTIWTPGAMALVFALAHSDIRLDSHIGLIIRFLSKISFAFFMFHYVALRYAHAALSVFGIEHSFLVGLATGFAVFFLTIVWAKIWTDKIGPLLTKRFKSLVPISPFFQTPIRHN